MPPTKLREITDLLHISQAELARKSGVSEQTIRRLLRGEQPSLDTARRVTLALGAPSTDVVFPPPSEVEVGA